MLIVKCSAGTRIAIGDRIAVAIPLIIGGDACLEVDCPEGMAVTTSAQEHVRRHLQERGVILDTQRTQVLSSRTQPDLLIGDNVRIVILPGAGSTIRLGIEAPLSMPIARNADTRPVRLTPLQEQKTPSPPSASDQDVPAARR